LLIESLPEADSIIVIWFKLLCLAGKQNNSGVFTMNGNIPYTDTMLSTIFRRKETTVKLALQTFEKFGMIEIIDNTITIPNWGKHQNLDRIEAKTEYMRNYMQDYRQKQKQLIDGKANSKANSKANVSEADKDIEVDIEIDKEKISDTDDDIILTTPKCTSIPDRPPIFKPSEPTTINQFIKSLPYSELFKSAFHDFAEMRQANKHSLTAKGAQMILNKLDKLSNTEQGKIDILNQSIENSWRGVFEIKGQEQQKKSNTPDYSKSKDFFGE
jgi:predicted phage replisome organizer